ncbi:hypothetical protein [Phyllobacterium sp. YR531]|uniref:hypothetical protein n=1 Tax=Phyllobacterium sp. YR531 TaxID=1144343 RepID=UPI00030F9B52|nr:hypothetical protein [Phyllobacterium sp. YR531]
MEKYGLNQRFTETSADAALTLDAMAGVIHPGSYEDRLENLTSVIKAYEKRITFLDSQLDFVEAVLVRVSSYHSDL